MRILYALLMLILIVVVVSQSRTSPAQDRNLTSPNWEYELSASKIPGVIDAAAFNALGSKGWELCATTGADNSVFVFKRLKR